MLRLKKVSCVHNVLKGKDDLPLTLSAKFVGTANATGCFLDIMLSPDKEQEAAWLTLERLLRHAARDSMMPGCHDVEEFYQAKGCTCGPSIGGGWHFEDCPLYQEAQE